MMNGSNAQKWCLLLQSAKNKKKKKNGCECEKCEEEVISNSDPL